MSPTTRSLSPIGDSEFFPARQALADEGLTGLSPIGDASRRAKPAPDRDQGAKSLSHKTFPPEARPLP